MKCCFYCSFICICSVLVQRGAPNSPAQVNLACANEATSVINLLGIIIQAFWASALWSPELWVIVLAGWDQQEPLFNRRQLCEGPHTLICLLFRPCLSALGSPHPLSDSCVCCILRVHSEVLGSLTKPITLSLESSRFTFTTQTELDLRTNIFRSDYWTGFSQSNCLLVTSLFSFWKARINIHEVTVSNGWNCAGVNWWTGSEAIKASLVFENT